MPGHTGSSAARTTPMGAGPVFVRLAMGLGLLTGLARPGPSQGAAPVGAGAMRPSDFPCWRGSCGNGAVDSDWHLERDLGRVKLLWTSEARGIGVGWGTRRGPSSHGRDQAKGAGFASLTVAHGRAYFVYWLPSGEVIDEVMLAKSKDKRRDSWRIAADDIILCLDAETGKTLWKAVIKGKGYNLNSNRHGPMVHACVAEGKVFAVGTTGNVYCLDAATGAPLWESDIGKGAELWRQTRNEALQARQVEKHGYCGVANRRKAYPFDVSPTYTDGVFVCQDEGGYLKGADESNGLVGFDAATGKRLWRIPDCGGDASSPVRWVHKGREYVISNDEKRAIAIEPRNGKVLWELTGAFHPRCSPAACENHLILEGRGTKGPHDKKSRPFGPKAYRITPEKAVKAWEVPVEASQSAKARLAKNSGCGSPAILDGHAYFQSVVVALATGKVAKFVPEMFGYGSFVGSDGLVILETKVFDARDGWKLLGTLRPGVEQFTGSTLADGRLYIRGRIDGAGPDPGCFYCFDLREAPKRDAILPIDGTAEIVGPRWEDRP